MAAMADELQQFSPVGTTWVPNNNPATQLAVTLTINVPEYANSRRNAITGQIEINALQFADLVSLRNSIDEQIVMLRQQDEFVWEPF
jgi:hypothetical protein